MYRLVLLLALVFAAPAFASDGDGCRSGLTYPGGVCKFICENHTGNTSCSVFQVPGRFSVITIEVQDSDCSAGTVALTQSSTSGGLQKTLGTSLDVISSDGDFLTIDGNAALPLMYITATASGMSGCTNGFDLVFHGVK